MIIAIIIIINTIIILLQTMVMIIVIIIIIITVIAFRARNLPTFGWHHLSNATCLMRPRLFYALLVVSRNTIMRYNIHHF